jgi:hypothetical protein
MQMNYYPKILPFYMTYPMPLIWEEEDTVMRDLEYLQELYPRQAKKYRKRIEELLERFDSEGSVLYDEYPDRMTLYKMAQDIYAVLEQEEKREQAEAAAVAAAPADGGEVSTTGDSISAGAAMNPAVRTAEAAAPLGPESMELIQVLLYGEIFRRRQKRGFRKF